MAVDGVVAAEVPPVPGTLIDALLSWHGKLLEVGHETFPLVAQRQSAPLTQIETLGQQMKQLESLSAVVRAELVKHYRAVQLAYREASAGSGGV